MSQETGEFEFDGNKYVVTDDNNPYSAAEHGDSAWLFHFGVYTPRGVLVYGHDLGDALELAAASGYAGGAAVDDDYMEERYKEAAEAEGLTLKDGTLYDEDGDEVDWDTNEGNTVRDNAEMDLTYTESGWLTSWEWNVQELHPPDPIYGAGVAAYVRMSPEDVDEDSDEVWETLTAAGATERQANTAEQALEDSRFQEGIPQGPW